ncbi:hypothetical protein HQ560_16730 [bacterium]|nr:hypothetical protein [bacterium]
MRLGSNITTEGYVIEAAFSWKALGVTPKTGHVAGLSVSVRDYDADGSAKGISWVRASDPSANPLRWGDLILVTGAGDSVAPVLAALSQTNARWQRLLDGSAKETENDVTVTLDWVSRGILSHGIGWNVQFRDGRFPKWDEAGWHTFLALLTWSRPAWIRYGVNLGHWEPKNDDDDPTHVNWEGFAFRSKAMRNHYRVLDVCEKNDIHVLWANWRVGDRATGVRWLAESVHDPKIADTDGDPFNDAPYDPEELAESLAACLYHLRVVRGYTCVRATSLWNEPNHSEFYNSPSAKYPETFWGYHTPLSLHLRRLGLRRAIQIVGPEAATSNYAALPWLGRHLKDYSPAIDVLAYHDYIGYADYHRVDRGVPIGGAAAHIAKLRARARRPVTVTELGNMGNGAGEVGGREAVWAGSLSTCRLILEGLNSGVGGFLRWEFKPYGASWQNFGALTNLSQKHLFEPYRPVYFPHALLCRATVRASHILKTGVQGGRDENGIARVTCAATNRRGHGTSILLVNDGFQPKNVTLVFDRRIAAAKYRFAHLSYGPALTDAFRVHPAVSAAAGKATLVLPPRSVHALSTRAGFGEPEPLPVLPPRYEPEYSSHVEGGRTVYSALMRFNADYKWHVWQSTAGHTTFQSEPESGKAKNNVCRVAYDFLGAAQGARAEHVVAHTDLMIDGYPRQVAYWVRGDGHGQRLALLFIDSKGEVFEMPTHRAIASKEWERLVVPVSDFPKDWNHWSGDGKVDYPLRGFGFVLTAPAAAGFRGRGILEVDGVQILSESR